MNKILTTFLFSSILGLTPATPLQNQLRTVELVQNPVPIDIHSSSRKPFPLLIPSITVRLPQTCSTGGPCNLRDEKCMSYQMLKYVNDFRKSKGLSKMLSTCSSSQLNNAVSHSKKMEARGSIYHQEISDVNLGCSTFFTGENVAKNHCGYDKKKTDPARLCVDQFIESNSHRKNLLSDKHESVAMGVYISDDGYIWCTQTFSQSTKYSNSGSCAPVGPTHSSQSAEEETKPQPLNHVEPTRKEDPHAYPCDSFETKEFKAKVRGSSEPPKKFKATSKNGECQYCTSQGLCLDPGYSEDIDDEISRR